MTELRALSASERAALTAVLSRQPPEHRWALAAQLATARVEESSSLHMLDLVVDHQAPVITVDDGPLTGRTLVVTDRGEMTGEIIVWVRGGMLSALEHAWYSEEPPAAWPEPHELSFE